MPGSTHMLRLVVLVTLAIGSTSLWAQDVPYVGEITDDEVTVRAGAGPSFYSVGTLKKGDRVTVNSVVFTWARIEPPKGVFGYISRGFVDVKGDGDTGVINQDGVAVHAASVDGPGASARINLYLNKDATVEIVATEGSFYRVVPPKGSHVFVPASSVKRIGPAAADPEPPVEPAPVELDPAPVQPRVTEPVAPPEPEQTEEPEVVEQPETQAPTQPDEAQADQSPAEPAPQPDADEEPEQPRVAQVEPKPADEASSDEVTAVEAEPDPETPVQQAAAEQPTRPKRPASPSHGLEPTSDAVVAAERQFAEADQLPLEEQPIEELIASYEQLLKDRQLPATDQRIVKFRIAQLKRNLTLATPLREIARVREGLRSSRSTEEAEPTGPVRYDAVGQLVASAVYDGKTLPRLFRVVTPGDQRTIAYVRPGNQASLSAHLGQIVGIRGETRYDPALKLRIVEVDQVDVLERSSSAR